jgi:hypothetical protein
MANHNLVMAGKQLLGTSYFVLCPGTTKHHIVDIHNLDGWETAARNICISFHARRLDYKASFVDMSANGANEFSIMATPIFAAAIPRAFSQDASVGNSRNDECVV